MWVRGRPNANGIWPRPIPPEGGLEMDTDVVYEGVDVTARTNSMADKNAHLDSEAERIRRVGHENRNQRTEPDDVGGSISQFRETNRRECND